MRLRPERAHEILCRVDPARQRSGWPVGLRDGALLALLAAGLTAREVSRLRASSVTMNRGKLLVAVQRHGVAWYSVLPADLGGRLLIWLTESRVWAEGKPVFPGRRGPLSPKGIYRILERYRQPCPRRRSEFLPQSSASAR
jgi:site-specific recombinase XerD